MRRGVLIFHCHIPFLRLGARWIREPGSIRVFGDTGASETGMDERRKHQSRTLHGQTSWALGGGICRSQLTEGSKPIEILHFQHVGRGLPRCHVV